jgi:16S rRNA (uracil1498-N3)-methyltransferase
VEADGPVERVERREPAITLGFAPVKGDRPDWVVQKLTELGVDRIVPLRADRSVVRWDGDRSANAVERLRRVAREAAMQARRCWLPVVEEPTVPAAVAGAALAEPGGGPLTLATPTALIGPEGGWSPAELGAASATISLGDLILRAETAAITVAARLIPLRDEPVI